MGISLLGMIGCNNIKNNNFSCIPTEVIHSYKLNQYTGRPTPTIFPVDSSWDPQLEQPIENLDEHNSMISQIDNNLIWLDNWDYIFSFNTVNKKIKQYKINNEKGIHEINTLLISEEGILWELGYWRKGIGSILNRYNPKIDEFEPVIDNNNLLIKKGNARSNFVIDSKGRIWIVIPNEGLYSFDPKIGTVEKKLQNKLVGPEHKILKINYIEELNGTIQIDQGDGVWMGANESVPNDNHNSIIFYDINIKQTKIFPLSSDYHPSSFSIFIDNESRLWVNDYAYRYTKDKDSENPASGWNIIVRSSIFISQRIPFNDFFWLAGEPKLEDSEGNIWFSGEGLIRLNLKTNQWCKVIDDFGRPSIIQTEDGQFWSVFNNQIYKHE